MIPFISFKTILIRYLKNLFQKFLEAFKNFLKIEWLKYFKEKKFFFSLKKIKFLLFIKIEKKQVL